MRERQRQNNRTRSAPFADFRSAGCHIEWPRHIPVVSRNWPAAAEDTVALSDLARRASIERARTDQTFIQSLDEACAKVEPIFRRIEALRMNLAKHEVKRKKNQIAVGPGYARLDESTA